MGDRSEPESEYDDTFVAALECMWGEGFLSPGGAGEVARILEGVGLAGKRVLDVGCGLGGIDVLLAREHRAGHVVGIDIEAPLIARARQLVAEAGLSHRITLELVSPGPFPHEADSFDVVFTKDSIIHVPDKTAFYREVLRVLRPGGWFVGSDWLRGGAGEYSAEMKDWFAIVGLTFNMENLEGTRRALESAGFVEVRLRDRNDWYRDEIKRELASISGENYPHLIAAVGEEAAAHRLKSSSTKKIVIDRGELRPTHFRGRKPVIGD